MVWPEHHTVHSSATGAPTVSQAPGDHTREGQDRGPLGADVKCFWKRFWWKGGESQEGWAATVFAMGPEGGCQDPKLSLKAGQEVCRRGGTPSALSSSSFPLPPAGWLTVPRPLWQSGMGLTESVSLGSNS